MRTEQIVELQKEVARLKNENKHYRIEKEASLLADKLISSYVEELEESEKRLRKHIFEARNDVVSQSERVEELKDEKVELYKLNAKLGVKAWDIEQQNKRYRKALEFYKDQKHFTVECCNEYVVDKGDVASHALNND